MNWNILCQGGAMQKGKQGLLVHIGQSTSSSQGSSLAEIKLVLRASRIFLYFPLEIKKNTAGS